MTVKDPVRPEKIFTIYLLQTEYHRGQRVLYTAPYPDYRDWPPTKAIVKGVSQYSVLLEHKDGPGGIFWTERRNIKIDPEFI